jgi:predicted DNA-binding helix-hairpin-helix protein
MKTTEDLKLLTHQMHLESAEDTGCPQIPIKHADDIAISQATLPNGQKIKLLKTLLTSVCERNCYYCPFRAGRDFRRATLSPDEMARLFSSLYQAGMVEGIFLSSGVIKGGIFTQDRLIATADLLRNRFKFPGYIHLKIMPGVEKDQVLAAMRYADRVSINLEAPNSNRLTKLAPKKQFTEELIQPLRWVEEIRQNQPGYLGWKGRWPSSVTQFVVGAVEETDLELMNTTEFLLSKLSLRRVYYSSFSPVSDTPFENLPPSLPRREFRLYEASFLLRDYGFTLEDLPFEGTGNLPLLIDPKLAWAQKNLVNSPIEINQATRDELLKIPGIGPKNAAKIIYHRHQQRLTSLSDLGKIGIKSSRAAPFILVNGKRPPHQLTF